MLNSLPPAATFVLYVVVFVGALIAFEGLRQLLSREEDPVRARNRRMRMIAKGASSEEVLSVLLDDAGRRKGLRARLSTLLRQSGLPITPAHFVGGGLLCGLAALAVVTPFLGVSLALPLALGVGALVPFVIVGAARKRRMARLIEQLPDALDLMARGLKVGHPVNVTIGTVAKDMADPIGSEFGILQDQVSYGSRVVVAFADMAERLDLEDIRYLAVSVGIQHGSGGNLARVLLVLSKVIRGRATMRRKIRAISAEGRFSALILSLLPFVIFGMISASSPSFYGDVSDDPLFFPIMGTILGLVLAQAFILHRMVSFKF